MNKIVKRLIKVVLGVVLVVLLVLGIVAYRYWDSIEILRGTQDVTATGQRIPEPVQPATTLREHGEADWPCWRGIHGDARSTVTGVSTQWTAGLTKTWEVDYLCQGKASAAWSAPVVQGDVAAAVEAKGLFYPPDPGSQAVSTIGGNVAENAGGLRGLKYGVTRDYVMGLSFFDVEGNLVKSGSRTVKCATGYNLTGLMVGSEGTLGVSPNVR